MNAIIFSNLYHQVTIDRARSFSMEQKYSNKIRFSIRIYFSSFIFDTRRERAFSYLLENFIFYPPLLHFPCYIFGSSKWQFGISDPSCPELVNTRPPKSDIAQIWDQLALLIKSHKLSYSILHEFQSHLYPVSIRDTDLQQEAR